MKARSSWADFLRNGTDRIPPAPGVGIIENLRTLWRTIIPARVDPAVADLQRQIEETRRLCSETQAARKSAEKWSADAIEALKATIIERNQLQDRLTAALLDVARMTAAWDAKPFFKEPS